MLVSVGASAIGTASINSAENLCFMYFNIIMAPPFLRYLADQCRPEVGNRTCSQDEAQKTTMTKRCHKLQDICPLTLRQVGEGVRQ